MARKRQETLVLFRDVFTITRKFTDAQLGALMRAAAEYRFEGAVYDGEDEVVDVVFQMLAGQINRYMEACGVAPAGTGKAAKQAEDIDSPVDNAVENAVETSAEEPAERAAEGTAAPNGDRNAPECTLIPGMDDNATHTYTRTPTHSHLYSYTHNHHHGQEAVAGESQKCFTPPTVEEVRRYAAENGYALDPGQFVDFYSANNWMIGKTRITDWKLAAKLWHGRGAGGSAARQ